MARQFFLVFVLFASATGLFAEGPTAFTADSDTVVLWAFDEGNGVLFNDKVGGLTLGVSPDGKEPVWVDGKFGKALSLPGETVFGGEYAEGNPPPDFSSGVTVEAWIKPSAEDEGNQMGLLQWANAFRWTIDHTGTIIFLVAGEGDEGSETGAPSKLKVPFGEWSHVAGTYDGSFIRVFINGELVGEQEFTNSKLITRTSRGPVFVGVISAEPKPYFIGEINGIRISNKARTDFPTQ
ncbi:MAG: LamG domain-containing protein [Terrimicrobiaceae bacterium]